MSRVMMALTLAALLWATSARSADLTLTGITDGSWIDQTFQATIMALIEGRTEVTVDIDSPGGYVMAGIAAVQFMEMGKSMGVSYKCRVTGKAMSAAFFLLSACTERSAVRSARLMWHGMWAEFRIVDLWPRTAEQDAELAEAYKVQVMMNDCIAKATRVSWAKWQPKFDDEFKFTPVQLAEFAPGFISVLPY